MQRVNAAARVADKWALNMDSERLGSTSVDVHWLFASRSANFFALLSARFDCVCEPFQRTQSRIQGGGNGSREITGNAMMREHFFDRRKRVRGLVHDVVSSAAMDVKIDEPRSDEGIAEVANRYCLRNGVSAARTNIEDASRFDEQQRLLDVIGRSQEPCSAKNQHRNVLIKEKLQLLPTIVTVLLRQVQMGVSRRVANRVPRKVLIYSLAQIGTARRTRSEIGAATECYTV